MSTARQRRIEQPELIYANDSILVVNKMVGLHVARPPIGEPTLLTWIERQGLGPVEALRPLRRQDRDASGLVLYSRAPGVLAELEQAAADGDLTEEYLALAQGYVAGDGEIAAPIRFDKSGIRADVDPRRGKDAVTRYTILQRVAGHTLLACQVQNGHPHQVRAHLAHAGHPLAVDPIYGGALAIKLSMFKSGYQASRRRDELPLIDRLTLHSWKIRLPARFAESAEAEEGRVAFEAPLPRDYQVALRQLERALTRPGGARSPAVRSGGAAARGSAMRLLPTKILWPTDFSELSKQGARYARAICEHFECELHVIHVLTPPLAPDVSVVLPVEAPVAIAEPELAQASKAEINDLVKRLFDPQTRITTDAFYGSPWMGVCDYAKRLAVDLIVVSTHGRTGLSHVLIGSTAERIVQYAPCPVLTVKLNQTDFVRDSAK